MDPAPEPSLRALGAAGLALSALVGVVFLGAMFAGDGSDVGGILPVGGGALILLTASVVAVSFGRLPRPTLGVSGTVLVVGLLALVGWIGATIAWSIAPDRSWEGFNRAIAFAAFLGVGVVFGAAARAWAVRLCAVLLACSVAAALVWALLGKVVPSLDPEGDLVARLNEPLDYWNALALIADVGLVLGLWVAGASRRLAPRLGGGVLVYVSALSLALTLSRVGLIAAVVVLAVWLALARERVEGALVLAVAGLPAALVAGWAFTRPALVETGAEYDDRVADGVVFGLLALAGAIVAAALVLLAVRSPLEPAFCARATRGVAVLVALVVVGSAAVGAVAVGNAIASGTSCAEVANAPSRLGSLDLNSRWCWWSEAWDIYVAHAPEGAGAGTFEIARKRYREDARAVTEPHSVPLRQLADGGFAALLLFAAVVVAGAAVCVCALRRLAGAERTAGLALVAAPLAYAVHALVDYEWDFLATTGPVFAALGVLTAAGRPERRQARAAPLAVSLAAIALTLAVLTSFVAPRVSESSVRASTRALIDRDLDRAQSAAERARSWNPLAVGPLVALARVDERAGDLDAAERRYVEAVELQPENPETWYALGIFELELRRDLCAAYRFLNEAYTRDPAGRQWYPGGPLDVSRTAVDEGACQPR